MICIHCQRDRVGYSRGLCGPCFRTAGTRDLYPVVSKFAATGMSMLNPVGILPTATTTATPGSEEKIRVLTERAEMGLALFHPRDGLPDE